MEASLRERAPQQYAQYEALQAQADVSWRISHASDAAIAAIAKVVTPSRQCALRLPQPSSDRRCLCSLIGCSHRQVWLLVCLVDVSLPLFNTCRD